MKIQCKPQCCPTDGRIWLAPLIIVFLKRFLSMRLCRPTTS